MNIIICVYPNAYIYADKDKEERGDYVVVGRVIFAPLSYKIFQKGKQYNQVHKDIKAKFEELKTQESVEISATGQRANIVQ